jgi:hypothetical protein
VSKVTGQMTRRHHAELADAWKAAPRMVAAQKPRGTGKPVDEDLLHSKFLTEQKTKAAVAVGGIKTPEAALRAVTLFGAAIGSDPKFGVKHPASKKLVEYATGKMQRDGAESMYNSLEQLAAKPEVYAKLFGRDATDTDKQILGDILAAGGRKRATYDPRRWLGGGSRSGETSF